MGVNFEDFKFNRQVLNAIADAGYTEATPVQQKAIPPILNGQDVMGIAQTGTGKNRSLCAAHNYAAKNMRRANIREL